jgi:hypothetical protein
LTQKAYYRDLTDREEEELSRLRLPVLSGDFVPCACCGDWVEVWHARWVRRWLEGQSGHWICDKCDEEEE